MMYQKSPLIIGFLSLLVALVLLGPAASADGEIELDRELSISEEPDSFHAVSISTGFNTNDRFDIFFDEGSVTVWYSNDVNAANATSWELELNFESIFEFKDNGNGYFDSGDTIFSNESLVDGQFSLTYTSVVLPEGGNKTTINAVWGDGLLALTFGLTTSPTVVDQVVISPTDIKLGIKISHFELTGEGDHIGLAISVDEDIGSSISYQVQDDNAELNLTKSTTGGFFRWSRTAMVDGVQTPVGSVWNGETLTLSYAAGVSIVHDPIIGVRSVAPLSGLLEEMKIVGSPVLYGTGLAFATATVIGAIALRQRRNH